MEGNEAHYYEGTFCVTLNNRELTSLKVDTPLARPVCAFLRVFGPNFGSFLVPTSQSSRNTVHQGHLFAADLRISESPLPKPAAAFQAALGSKSRDAESRPDPAPRAEPRLVSSPPPPPQQQHSAPSRNQPQYHAASPFVSAATLLRRSRRLLPDAPVPRRGPGQVRLMRLCCGPLRLCCGPLRLCCGPLRP